MWKLEHKKDWAWKNWCFWTVVLEKTLETPLDSKEIKAVSAKGNQPWIFIGRTDAAAPLLWSLDEKSQLIGNDWRSLWEKLKVKGEGVAEDEMVRKHHWLNGYEFQQALKDTGGQRSLGCYNPWDGKESLRTGLSIWTTAELFISVIVLSVIQSPVESYNWFQVSEEFISLLSIFLYILSTTM